MSIKLSDVKGLMVEKKELIGNVNELAFESAWNSCRKIQGEKSIGLNREKLARTLSKCGDDIWKRIKESSNSKRFYEMADIIILEESDLIEYVDEK